MSTDTVGRAAPTFTDLLADDPSWSAALPVLQELRPDLTAEQLRRVVTDGQAERLTFTACSVDGAVVAVAGWRVMTTTYAGRKLHVDDLVVAATARGSGVGAAVLAHLEQRARSLDCTVIDLDSRVHRHAAHRFYLRERFDITAHHFLLAVR